MKSKSYEYLGFMGCNGNSAHIYQEERCKIKIAIYKGVIFDKSLSDSPIVFNQESLDEVLIILKKGKVYKIEYKDGQSDNSEVKPVKGCVLIAWSESVPQDVMHFQWINTLDKTVANVNLDYWNCEEKLISNLMNSVMTCIGNEFSDVKLLGNWAEFGPKKKNLIEQS